ncbi:hypothetical protein ABIF56_004261 [Bradyrhizobium elkanii]
MQKSGEHEKHCYARPSEREGDNAMLHLAKVVSNDDCQNRDPPHSIQLRDARPA